MISVMVLETRGRRLGLLLGRRLGRRRLGRRFGLRLGRRLGLRRLG